MPSNVAQSSTIRTGCCLCGAVRIELHGEPRELLHCHCGMCRKAHGAACASFLHIDHADFVITTGDAQIRSYRSSSWATRTFCGDCGSALQFIRDGHASFGLAASLLDAPLPDIPVRQYCSEDRVTWGL